MRNNALTSLSCLSVCEAENKINKVPTILSIEPINTAVLAARPVVTSKIITPKDKDVHKIKKLKTGYLSCDSNSVKKVCAIKAR